MIKSLLLIFLFTLFSIVAHAQPIIEEAFSPYQGATELVVKAIGEAQKTIRVAAYSFTSRPIAQALVNACNHGVEVQIVFDKSQSTNSFIPQSFGGTCVQARFNDRYSIMHDKFVIVDDSELETGSFNFTGAAQSRNAENVIIIHDDFKTIDAYRHQWEKLWDEAK